jgi:RNA polymerase sigma-70 factor (ECF subfamily)
MAADSKSNHVADPTDEELVERLQAASRDDLRSFDELVRRHRQRVMTNCRYLTGNPGHAEDLTQEVFVKAYFALQRFQHRSSFRTWIQRIKANHCMNYLRSQSRRPETIAADELGGETTLEGSVPSPEAHTSRLERRARIAATLDQMPETLRVPLILRDLDGMAYSEIAAQLGIGLSAAKMRIKRGRSTFRELFDTPGSGESPSDLGGEPAAHA